RGRAADPLPSLRDGARADALALRQPAREPPRPAARVPPRLVPPTQAHHLGVLSGRPPRPPPRRAPARVPASPPPPDIPPPSYRPAWPSGSWRSSSPFSPARGDSRGSARRTPGGTRLDRRTWSLR